MRSFFILWAMCLFLFTLNAQANDKARFFTIELVKTEQSTFDALLKKAMQIELVRLSGSEAILKKEAAQAFFKQPKRWLERFSYAPIYSEGVVTGQKIVFQFDANRLYQQFQKENLIVWPLNQRPKIWVQGVHYLDTSPTYLTQDILPNRADVDFAHYAKNMSMPMIFPKTKANRFNLNSDLDREVLMESMKTDGIDYVLKLTSKQDISGQIQLVWTLLNKQLNPVEQGRLGGQDSVLTYYEQLVNQLMQRLSAPYRQNAQILGEVTLKVSGIDAYAKISTIETFLQQQKPILQQVKLSSVDGQTATFDLIYQGELKMLINRLQRSDHLGLTQNDAVIGRLNAEWE